MQLARTLLSTLSSNKRVVARNLATFGVLCGIAVVASCGARTGLDSDDYADARAGDGSADGPFETGADASRDATLDAPITCTPGEFPLTEAFPAVMFVIDRSTSMNQRFSGGDTRWNVLKQALAATLPPVDRTMAIGALVYPAADGASCTAPGSPDLFPAVSNVDPLLAKLASQGPSGSTPTAQSLDAAASALAGMRTATSGKAIVLATDGAPDCNYGLDPATCRCVTGATCTRAERCLDDTRTVQAIARFAAQDIPTYVIGIQDSTNATYSDVLDAMAVAGGRARAGTRKYYAATSSAELRDALVTIRAQVGECTFLSTSVPSDSGSITLTLGGVPVPFDPTGQNGWRWANRANGEIVLTTDLCSRAATGSVPFTATVSCDPPDAGSDAADASEDADAPDADPIPEPDPVP